jgi:xanthine dehydrogenase YagS FAD-binding subunit
VPLRRLPEHRHRDPHRAIEGSLTMEPFMLVRAPDLAAAVESASAADSAFVAGGTTLVDLMRLEVMRPHRLVDLGGLALASIEDAGGGVRLGALASNTDAAYHPLVRERFPLVADALLSGASPQLRNMATIGGNVMQRTRCPYFRDVGTAACNKRVPGSGCAAHGGYQRSHAVLGGSDACIATHPSDLCVALAALDAIVHTQGASGPRSLGFADLHTMPGAHPEIEHVLAPGEVITAIELPAASAAFAKASRYVKVRDRASFSFALASAAVGLVMSAGTIESARVALGGVATKPWRCREAEASLVGGPATAARFAHAATIALAQAAPAAGNAWKVPLAQRTIVRALVLASGGAS